VFQSAAFRRKARSGDLCSARNLAPVLRAVTRRRRTDDGADRPVAQPDRLFHIGGGLVQRAACSPILTNRVTQADHGLIRAVRPSDARLRQRMQVNVIRCVGIRDRGGAEYETARPGRQQARRLTVPCLSWVPPQSRSPCIQVGLNPNSFSMSQPAANSIPPGLPRGVGAAGKLQLVAVAHLVNPFAKKRPVCGMRIDVILRNQEMSANNSELAHG